ncbi:MAG: STAS domain-containing protein [Pseudonocardiales bacterium]|nr:STAS domain-containing protein [Pseudonocardiales bacterium]
MTESAPRSGHLSTHVSTPSPGRVIVHVSGEVDTLTAPELDAALDRQLDGPATSLVLDLTGVGFLASSGLAVLIKAAHVAEERGVALSLVTANRAVVRPLEVTKTAGMFTIHDSLVTAEAALDRDGTGSSEH